MRVVQWGVQIARVINIIRVDRGSNQLLVKAFFFSWDCFVEQTPLVQFCLHVIFFWLCGLGRGCNEVSSAHGQSSALLFAWSLCNFFFSVMCATCAKEAVWINLRALVSVHFVVLDCDLGVRKSKHRLFLFCVIISDGFCICGIYTIKLFVRWNSKRNRIACIDLSALRFNKKEWLAVWVHEIWLITWDYTGVESNPQTGIHPFLFDFKLFNVVWLVSP